MRLLYIALLGFLNLAATAQPRPSGMDSLLQRLNTEHRDTGRLRILLQLDSTYYSNQIYKPDFLDSAVLLSQQARTLSSTLKDEARFQAATQILIKALVRKKDIPAAKHILDQTRGEALVMGLVQIGEYYTFKPGQLPENLDSAAPYIQLALAESRKLPGRKPEHTVLSLKGKWYYEHGETKKGEECFLQVIREFHTARDTANEAFWWEELGIYLPDTDSTYALEVLAYSNARRLLQAIGDKQEESSVAGNLAYVYQLHGMNDSAERLYLRQIELKKQLGNKNQIQPYAYLVEVGLAMGNYQKSIYYAFQALKYIDSANDYATAGIVYFNLGEAYRDLGETEKALEWYQRSLTGLKARRTEYLYSVAARIADCRIKMGQPDQALSFLQTFAAQNPPPRHSDREFLSAALGDAYYHLGNNRQAETKYLVMISADSLARKQRGKEIFAGQSGSILNTSGANYLLGRFYFLTGKFPRAETYLTKALQKDVFPAPLLQTRDIHVYLFKTDSALGRYAESIKELNLARTLNDSIFNIEKNKQIEELQASYQLRQKQQAIELLQKDQALQTTQLQRTRQTRNLTLLALAILITALYIAISRYRLKQRLVKEKDTLLEQKEWLVREIHHRVKNNLQIVISLLNTQAKYLTNEEAIAAISDSRHRMHAVSLIHQKLFQSEDNAFVSMQSYIDQLIGYLRSSFDTDGRIRFAIEVDPVELDLAQAIPLGLILNEAVTNAIKYAFPNNEKGRVGVEMHCLSNNEVELKIHDNGRGLPADFDLTRAGSMGMKLMRGLTKQIGGIINIEQNQGVGIAIRFTTDSRMRSIINPVENEKKKLAK